MEREINGRRLDETFWSMAEYAKVSAKRATLVKTRDEKGYFTDLPSHAESVRMCQNGWTEELPAALEVAESAVATADQEHMTDTFLPTWDVTGAEVDVARYLSGEPECMIDFPLSKTSKSGRVITMVASICYSGAIETDTVIRRGRVMTALALALSRLGHAVEIWADLNLRGDVDAYQRILVKGASDELDPAAVLFAFAHPAMLRRVGFGTWDGFPGQWAEDFSKSSARGSVGARTKKDKALYPEGTIFLPELRYGTDIPEADQFLKRYLGELGLLASE